MAYGDELAADTEVTSTEAARIAGISRTTLRRYEADGRIAPVRRLLGARRDRRFRVSDARALRAEMQETEKDPH